MNRLPLAIGVGVCASVVGLAWYVIHSGPGSFGTVDISDDSRSASASDVLAAAPAGVIPPTTGPIAAPAPASPQPTQQQAAQPAKPAPAETEAEIAVRRQAWDTYRQTLDEQRKRLIAQAVAGMTGDTIPSSSQASSTVAQASLQPPADPGQAAFSGMPPGWAMSPSAPRQDFWNARQNPDYQPDIVTKPVSPYEIKAGDLIDAVAISGMNSDTKGQIVAQVTKPVLDYATGTHILIPQGARLIGYYNTDVAYGQNRLEAGFDRVIFPPPGSESLRLVRTPGSDQEGYAGFHDITENHLGRIIFNALLGAAFSAGIQLSQPAPSAFGTYSPGQIAAGAVGQQANQVGNEFVRRGLDIPPTQKVRNGYRFTILVKQDIAFSRPWQPSPAPASGPIRLVDAN